MSYETLSTKKFLDLVGTGYLWSKIKDRYDAKLDEVTAANDSILVTNNNEVSVKISEEPDNVLQIKTTGNKGLYVPASANTESYEITKDPASGDYAAVYHLTKYVSGTPSGYMGVAINIPKDMVISSGSVVTKSTSGAWGGPGTYIEMVLANSEGDKIYIAVDDLIEYITSGSQVGDMVMINIDANHQVTATISDGSITMNKLHTAVQTMITAGASAVQNVTEGTANGTINVDGTDVAVHGLGTAAYASTGAFDPSGAAANVLGTNSDTASMNTVYGVKQYASDVYTSITAMTNADIDTAIADAV